MHQTVLCTIRLAESAPLSREQTKGRPRKEAYRTTTLVIARFPLIIMLKRLYQQNKFWNFPSALRHNACDTPRHIWLSAPPQEDSPCNLTTERKTTSSNAFLIYYTSPSISFLPRSSSSHARHYLWQLSSTHTTRRRVPPSPLGFHVSEISSNWIDLSLTCISARFFPPFLPLGGLEEDKWRRSLLYRKLCDANRI